MRFCEECGAQLEDNAKFCEECGAEQEPLQEQSVSVVEQNPLTVENVLPTQMVTVGSDCVPSQLKESAGSKKWIYLVVFVILLLAAGGIGYWSGHKNVIEINENQGVVQNSMITPTGTPMPVMEATATPKLTEAPEVTVTPKLTEAPEATATPKPTAASKPTATPKPTAKPNPTEVLKPTVTPTPVPSGSVFEGFSVEYEYSVWRLQTPEGIQVNLSNDPRAQGGYISNGDRIFHFDFDELLVGTDATPIIYTFLGEAGQIDPEYGYYDELRLSFTDAYVTIYWTYHAGQAVEVLYNNTVSTEHAECRSNYVSYGEQAMKKSAVTVEKQISDDLFRTIKNGELWSAELYADSEEEISVLLSYNVQTGATVIDLYQYDESEHLFGVTTRKISYDKDECFYLVSRASEGDFWGDPMQDLAEYDMYYAVNLNVSEAGIRLQWVFCENGEEKLLYDGMIDVGYIERRVTIENY